MNLEEANNLLPKFQLLQGFKSKTYNSTIEMVFVSFQDTNLTTGDFRLLKETNSRMPRLPLDEGRFTIVAGLENNEVVDIKSIVQRDEITDLLEDVVPLDYMYQRQM